MIKHPNYARRYSWALVEFSVLQAAYIALQRFGPSYRASYAGMVIQATGQKLIVYASIISITIQAWGARKFSAQRQGSHTTSDRAAVS